MNCPEQILHQAVAKYLDLALPADSWWTTIPLGGGGQVRGAFLKSMGAKKGTPDILVVYRGKAHWIELKAPRGRSSVAQVETMNALINADCHYSIAYSLFEVAGLLLMWKIPSRARLAA